jgi:hypothetical protein
MRPRGFRHAKGVGILRRGRTLGPMRWLLLFLVILVLIGGGMKLGGMQLPVIDYPLGQGPLGQPQIQVEQPNLNLP